jgi:hypothetical protein
MKWRELRGFYFPLCMEEISKVKTKYINLIQQIQKTNQEKDFKAFLELKKSIEQRIIDIDKFIEEKFDQPYVLHFEKCKIKLKKILQLNPKEKLSKQNINKNYHDIDCLNKVLKKQQEKDKLEQKNKMKDEPIYNKLPVDYGLYEGIIENMKLEDIRNKNYLNPNKKYFGDNSISDESESNDNSSENKNNKNLRFTFGNNNNLLSSNISDKSSSKKYKYINSKVINEK